MKRRDSLEVHAKSIILQAKSVRDTDWPVDGLTKLNYMQIAIDEMRRELEKRQKRLDKADKDD